MAKKKLKDVDFARLWISVSTALAVIGILGHFYLSYRFNEAKSDQTTAYRTLQQVASQRKNINNLEAEKEDDAWARNKAQDRLNEFFAQISQQAKMPRGPSTGKAQNDTPPTAKGYTDTSWELTWTMDRTERTQRGFTRQQVAAFLWYIENRTTLLKTTQLSLATDVDLLNDLWIPAIWVTERRPVSQAGT